MHRRPDFAHAAAVDSILRAHGVFSSPQAAGEGRSRGGGGPLGGRGRAATSAPQNGRAAGPRSGGR
jgi:hypothetical protein